MIRLAWHWLGRWQEPLSVGASVALVGLVYLMPVSGESALAPLAGQPQQASTVGREAAPRSPADAQYYRDQWSREAAQFYALHPPRRDARAAAGNDAPAVTTAKASFVESQPPSSTIAQAAHVTTALPHPVQDPPIAIRSPAPRSIAAAVGPPEWIMRWRIAASLAAGLLAGLAFVSIWPASPLTLESKLAWQRPGVSDQSTEQTPAESANEAARLAAETAPGEWLAIRLPAAWVGVRPTTGETLRRAVLAASYLIASLCGWSLLN